MILRIDDQAAVLAEQGAGAIHLGSGDPPGGVAQAVLRSGRDLALRGNLAPQASVGDLQAAYGGAAALLVMIQGPTELRLKRLDPLQAGADLLLESLALGVGDQAILGFRVSPVLHDLVDGVMLGEELEAVLLPPAQSQAVHHLGGGQARATLVSTGICCPSSPRNRMLRRELTRRRRVFFSNSW